MHLTTWGARDGFEGPLRLPGGDVTGRYGKRRDYVVERLNAMPGVSCESCRPFSIMENARFARARESALALALGFKLAHSKLRADVGETPEGAFCEWPNHCVPSQLQHCVRRWR